MPVPYIITETNDGRYIVQTPNWMGGLFPLVEYRDDIRTTPEVFRRIGEHALDTGNLYDGVTIEFRYKGHPDNDFVS